VCGQQLTVHQLRLFRALNGGVLAVLAPACLFLAWAHSTWSLIVIPVAWVVGMEVAAFKFLALKTRE
jgi:hypothetical protein